MKKTLTHLQMSSKGGKSFWKYKTPEERSKIMKERLLIRYARKLATK